MNRQYNSFEEIDAQLKILELRRQIDKEYVKLECSTLKHLMIPRNLWRSLESTFQGVLISLLVGKLLKRK
ncbi:MAG: DUF6327 family protein [Flavobacteriaceae bacterium]